MTLTDSDGRRAFPVGRMTAQRRAMADAASSFSGAFTVDELAERVRQVLPAAGSIATAYRAVAAMESSGYVTRVGSRAGAALYARCGAEGHHHHVVCDGCGRIAPAECPLPRDLITPDGFRVTRHDVTLYGLCPACAEEAGA